MKKINYFIYFFLIIFMFSGCAIGGVVRTGKDTYMISGSTSTPFSKGATVLAKLYRIGNEHCISKNKQLYSMKSECGNWAPFVRWSTAELTFKCLSEDDSRLREDADESDIELEDSVEFKIKTLSKLLSEGLITQDDCEEQKKKILDNYSDK